MCDYKQKHKKYSQKLTRSVDTQKQFFKIYITMCQIVPYRMAFIWHSPSESTRLFGSKNICQAKIRRICPELRVLYNVKGLTNFNEQG